jgi:hypothetical protein
MPASLARAAANEAQVPGRRVILAIVDNYVTHKQPKLRDRLSAPPAGPYTSPQLRPPSASPSKTSSPAHHAAIEARHLRSSNCRLPSFFALEHNERAGTPFQELASRF